MYTLSFVDSFKQWFSDSLPVRIYDTLPTVLLSLSTAAVTLFIGFWLGKIANKLLIKLLERNKVDPSVHYFLGRFLSVIIKIVFAVMALSQLGFNINSFVAALGAAGITAGLGLKDCISQFASGIEILFNKPFHSGDFIEVEGVSGKVQEIHFMYTNLLTLDNKQVIIPNDHLTSKSIINYTAHENRRVDLEFCVSYDADINKAKGILYRTARDNPHVITDPKPFVAVKEHSDSCIKLACLVWCKSENYWQAYYSMQEDVKNAFDENSIEIPYNQLDVHIKEEKKAN